ncbi:outer membrane OprD family porin [Acinetobacter calcoaceticus]|uniref:Outer membrane OprD family porin n=1 Tax=Acinetobacter calcoaceticus TaxID=471 RepID=A0A4R1Y471_ACICA|nr:outer membrane OprD family porin [Acinetobacter calcoaceticus]
MLNVQKLTLAALIQVFFVSSAFASEQSESKGFVDDTTASVLLRNGWIGRDKKDPDVHDQSSWGQAAMVSVESGFTPGIVGFGIGITGDVGFKIGENKHSGNDMLPLRNDGSAYDHWGRGGANVKARISNTTIRYGTQIVDLPVLQSNTVARLIPEYYTGTSINSNEIKNLELSAGYFTKDQLSNQIATDQNKLKRAVVYGGKYKFNDDLSAAYYGANLKDALDRHYLNMNYKYPLANDSALTFDFSGYHTKYNKEIYDKIAYSATGAANTSKTNDIWALSGSYKTGPHNLMLAYQQNSGDVGYVYNVAGAGGSSMYLPNSYLSDFVGNGEKSVQLQYSLDFNQFGIPGLNWTTAYVYGWDINVQAKGKRITDDAREREFFNQVKYTVQSGAAKDLSFKVRNSIYRADKNYTSDYYIGSTDEWRIFVEYPFKFL